MHLHCETVVRQKFILKNDKKLSSFFEEVIHFSNINIKAPADDLFIWKFAKVNSFTIISKDDDFEKIVLIKTPSKLIYLKTYDLDTTKLINLIIENLVNIKAFEIYEKMAILKLIQINCKNSIMNQNITINDFSQHLLRDVDLSDFDFQKHKVHLIQKVLEYGLIKDWNLLKQIYGLKTIKEVSLNLRSLAAVTLSYLATIFNINKKEFRCYKHKQLFANYWNS